MSGELFHKGVFLNFLARSSRWSRFHIFVLPPQASYIFQILLKNNSKVTSIELIFQQLMPHSHQRHV